MKIEQWHSGIGRVVRMRVSAEYPPVPSRKYDWSAIDDDTYDGTPDAGRLAHLSGHGETPEEAIADLMQQLDEFYLDLACGSEPQGKGE